MVAPLRSGDPARLGSYQLLGRIGVGGQGTVFLGEDRAGVKVAVKILSADLVGDDVARRRFAGEVALVRHVSSFCVAEVLDADLDGERPYIVSEYVPGPSLQEAVATTGPLAPGALGRLAVSTVTALAAVHDAGIVHRDFKPHNVLLGPDGPRVIDFGIARLSGAAVTATGQIIGTIAYMSPEQIGGGTVGAASDMFSWAVTMAYAAGGRRAFDADTVPAIMHRILFTHPELPTLPDGLAGVLMTCLAKEPTTRPTAKDVLLQLIAGSAPGATAAVRAGTPVPGTEPVTPQGAATGSDATTVGLGGTSAGTVVRPLEPVGPGRTVLSPGERGPGGTVVGRPGPVGSSGTTVGPPDAPARATGRTRRRWPWLAGVAVVLVAVVVGVTLIVRPFSGPPARAAVDGTLIYSDSFTDRLGWDGWNFNPDATGDEHTVRGYEITKGVYSMQADGGAPDVAALSPSPPKQSSSAPGLERQVMIGATAEIQSGSAAPGGVGLLCLWDEDTPFGYQLLLGLDGGVTIEKTDGGTRLLATGFTSAPPIGRAFSLQAACRNTGSGTELRFWVNGEQVLEVTDPGPLPTTGSISQIGFRVRVPEGRTNRVRVSWDDLTEHRLT